MTKIRLRWLWVIIGVEIAGIIGLVVWAQTLRPEPEPAPQLTTQVPSVEPEKPKVTYKTPKIKLVKVVEGFTLPVVIAAMPDVRDKRLFVVEQGGKVFVVNQAGKLDKTPFLDIDGRVLGGGEMGLLGLAFHPKVVGNGYFYVNYIDNNQNTVVSRFTISAQTGRADAGSEKVILKLKQPFTNHNGGNMAFGPDGYLYTALGDGGSRGDPGNRSQNKNELLGKILRVDVDGGALYRVPQDNPFANSGGGKPEIWALGLRNPWRFSFDRKTGDLYIADVGQGEYEEINFQKSDSQGGENYGWRCYEGTHAYNTDGCGAASTFTPPIIEYNHDDGRCSVTGGFVYRGQKFPALDGKYFYGDYCNGHIYYAQPTGGAWKVTSAIDTDYHLSTFGQDSAGELYVADYSLGVIYQVTDTAN